MRTIRNGVIAALAAAAGLPAGAASADCRLQPLAVIPVTMVGLRPIMTATINGQKATFLVDSGAFYSTLSPAAAQRLGLTDTGTRSRIQGVGGAVAARLAKVDTLEFAGLSLSNQSLLIAPGGGGGVDGLLGENILGLGDVEYDLANGVVRLFKPDACGDADMAYWAGGQAARIPLTHTARRPGFLSDDSRHVIARGAINGRSIAVTLDTGATRTMLTQAAAARAGVTPATPGTVPEGVTSGIGPIGIQVWRAPFQSFTLGAEDIRNPVLSFADIQLMDADMLLGADFFLAHRVFVANSQGRAYLTLNAGPAPRPGAAAAVARDDLDALRVDTRAGLSGIEPALP